MSVKYQIILTCALNDMLIFLEYWFKGYSQQLVLIRLIFTSGGRKQQFQHLRLQPPSACRRSERVNKYV